MGNAAWLHLEAAACSARQPPICEREARDGHRGQHGGVPQLLERVARRRWSKQVDSMRVGRSPKPFLGGRTESSQFYRRGLLPAHGVFYPPLCREAAHDSDYHGLRGSLAG